MVSRADHIRQHTENQLSSHGINVVIYANHLLRAAYPAMQRAARDILTHRKAGPLNEYCVSSHDLLSLFPEPDVCSLRAS
jgi:2-methylisocitrate lyase-like PEP mutase family enzyme